MPKNTHVTNRQGVQFAQLGRKNNVSRAKMKEFLEDENRLKEFFNQFKLRNFQDLESEKIISIPKISFNPDEFFVQGISNSGIRMRMNDNVQDIFLPLLSKNIEFDGIDLEKLRLKKDLSHFDIQKEIGHQVQTPDAIAAEIKHLISQQPKGEKKGDLDVPFVLHIFYFEYLDCVYCMRLYFHAKWSIYCYNAHKSEISEYSVVFNPAINKS